MSSLYTKQVELRRPESKWAFGSFLSSHGPRGSKTGHVDARLVMIGLAKPGLFLVKRPCINYNSVNKSQSSQPTNACMCDWRVFEKGRHCPNRRARKIVAECAG